MNNLEPSNRLVNLASPPIDLSQTSGTHRQLRPDEGPSIFQIEDFQAKRRDAHQRIEEPRSFFLAVQTQVPRTRSGLLHSLSGRLSIGCYAPPEYQKPKPRPLERTGYEKNGILVHHGGRVIASRDVEEALAEE